MLRITIEIVPFGNEEEQRILSIINIINDGTGSPRYGNYKVKRINFNKENQFPANDEFEIKKYNRYDGYLKLIQKVINKFVRLDCG